MPGKNSKKMIGACVVTAALLCAPSALKAEGMLSHYTCVADAIQKDNRPEPAKRLFRSQAVENEIIRVQKLLRNSKLAWMFTNCFPNTLDTTVHFRKGKDGKPDTFVYTGDIHAMWLRDSGAQVWPYVQLANSDPELKTMLAGVINRQFKCINIDPYANAFNDGPKGGEWMSDLTDMKPELHGDPDGMSVRVYRTGAGKVITVCGTFEKGDFARAIGNHSPEIFRSVRNLLCRTNCGYYCSICDECLIFDDHKKVFA